MRKHLPVICRTTSLVMRTQKMFFLTSVFILCLLASSSTHTSLVPAAMSAAAAEQPGSSPAAPCREEGAELVLRPTQAEPMIHHRPG